MKKILFVCSGNTCRSPLAEGIAKKIFQDNERHDYEILSAGSSALDGLPASSTAREVAQASSIDLSSHRARLLNRNLVNDVDLIIVMTANHRETVRVIEPSAGEYTYLLTDFSDDEDGEVPDPIGAGREMYQKTFSLIEKCITNMVNKLDAFDGWKSVEKG